MKKIAKIIGIIAAVIIVIAAIVMLWYYWFARFEPPHMVFVLLMAVFLYGAVIDSDSAPPLIFLAIICFSIAFFLPKTGDTTTECLEWNTETKQIKKEYRGTKYVEPPEKYCIKEQTKIRIDNEWKVVVGE